MKEIKRFVEFIIEQFKKRPIVNYSAQMTYGALLAFTPLLMFFFNILSIFAFDNGRLIIDLEKYLPSFLTPLIETAAVNAQNPYHSIFSNIIYGFFIIYFSIYVLRLFFLTNTKVLGIRETRSIVQSYIKSALYMLLVVIMVLAFIGIYFVIKNVMVSFFNSLGIYQFIEKYWQVISVLIIASVLSIMLAVLYMISPPKPMPFLAAVPGSIFVSFSWMLITLISKNILEKSIISKTITYSLEWPFIVVITIFLVCFMLVFGMLINMYFIKTGRTRYEESCL